MCKSMCDSFRGVSCCVSLPEDVRGSRCRSGILIVGVMAAGVVLGIGFGAVLNYIFSGNNDS